MQEEIVQAIAGTFPARQGRIPFLRPRLAPARELLPHLEELDRTRIYSNYGPLNTRFERRILDEYFGGAGGVTTVANATLGLMLSLAEVKRPGARYAVMPSFTFAATAQAALWCGLEPYFVDIRPDDWCMDEEQLADKLRELGDAVAAIVPYSCFGNPLDLSGFEHLHRSGVPVVLDAASSFGSARDGCQLGQGFPGMVVFSFHATKPFPIGEGGLVYSADAAAIARLRRAGNFGFGSSREAELPGLNAKLSEYGAAVGLATLDTFARRLAWRRELCRAYVSAFEGRGLLERGWQLQRLHGDVAFQFMPALCPPDLSNQDVVGHLERQDIEIRTYFWPPCHEQPVFRAAPRGRLPVTDAVSRRVVSLPLWEEMTFETVYRVVEALATLPPRP